MCRIRPLCVAVAVLLAVPLWAQAPPTTAPEEPAKKLPAGLGGGPRMATAHLVTVNIELQPAEAETARTLSPEAEALMQRLRGVTKLTSRFHLSGDISHQEILSEDFILPQGTIVMHQAGKRFFAVIDPVAKTFLPVDAETVLNALEGGAGIENSQYDVRVDHTTDRKTIAGLECRRSIVKVAYVSSIPFENDRVFVQQKNEIEVWHTPKIPSSSAMEHLFFKFQRDQTGTVQRTLAAELGFPMQVSLVATQGKKDAAAPGSFTMTVTEARTLELEAEFFQIPPPEYQRIDKNPYFAAAE